MSIDRDPSPLAVNLLRQDIEAAEKALRRYKTDICAIELQVLVSKRNKMIQTLRAGFKLVK